MTSMQTIPYIPENAPFSPEQRAWLNGFLAGLFSTASGTDAGPETTAHPSRFGVFFASQTGTAERLAKKLAKELKAQGHTTEVASLEKITPAQLAKQENALIFASTYGEGDPPESAKSFCDQLFSSAAPDLTRLRYSVFCLGDKNYEHFCKFGADLDERLAALGAARLLDRVESDVEVEAPFSRWKDDLQRHLLPTHNGHGFGKPQATGARPHTTFGSSDAVTDKPAYTRENPYAAPLRERRALTSGLSSKLTLHLSFALEDSALLYEAGDACGVIAQNDPALVEELLTHLPFDSSAAVTIAKAGTVPVREALLHHLQPTRLTRKIVQHFADKSGSRSLNALLSPEQAVSLQTYMYDRGLIDLLSELPGLLTDPDELVTMLPRLSPRLYSISSSPAAHRGEVHCTVAVVRYRSHNRERGGIASTMLADRVDIGQHLPIYIQPNKRFRIPRDSSTPIIMIGPGTGIAPFRAFLHERQALGHMGRNWLLFGERSARTDFLYREELQGMCDSGHLTRLDTAFSRDGAHKVYVQNRMLEHGAELWRWLDEGAQLFVCGDATRMAKDVDAALHAVLEKHGGMNADAAREYITEMHDSSRYHRDVY